MIVCLQFIIEATIPTVSVFPSKANASRTASDSARHENVCLAPKWKVASKKWWIVRNRCDTWLAKGRAIQRIPGTGDEGMGVEFKKNTVNNSEQKSTLTYNMTINSTMSNVYPLLPSPSLLIGPLHSLYLSEKFLWANIWFHNFRTSQFWFAKLSWLVASCFVSLWNIATMSKTIFPNSLELTTTKSMQKRFMGPSFAVWFTTSNYQFSFPFHF